MSVESSGLCHSKVLWKYKSTVLALGCNEGTCSGTGPCYNLCSREDKTRLAGPILKRLTVTLTSVLGLQNTGEESDEYLFLERQLELFGMLCHGQNQFAINVITTELDYLTWKESYTCLSDVYLPDRLRAKYCDLIISE